MMSEYDSMNVRLFAPPMPAREASPDAIRSTINGRFHASRINVTQHIARGFERDRAGPAFTHPEGPCEPAVAVERC
jgi:hypothetical protein